MSTPGIIGTNHLGGLQNGILGQANSAHSGNPINAQPASVTYTGQGRRQFLMQQLAAQQQAAAYLHAQNISAPGSPFQGVRIPSQSVAVAPAKLLRTEAIKLGEIIAFRGWNITEGGFLKSMSANVIWGPGEVMEGKTKSMEEHCGVYAFKTAKDFLSQLADRVDIYGRVALWGDIIEHENGYRAQYAKIVGLEYLLRRSQSREGAEAAAHNFSVVRKRYCPEAT